MISTSQHISAFLSIIIPLHFIDKTTAYLVQGSVKASSSVDLSIVSKGGSNGTTVLDTVLHSGHRYCCLLKSQLRVLRIRGALRCSLPTKDSKYLQGKTKQNKGISSCNQSEYVPYLFNTFCMYVNNILTFITFKIHTVLFWHPISTSPTLPYSVPSMNLSQNQIQII